MKFATVLHDERAKTTLVLGSDLVDLGALAASLDKAFPEVAFPVGRDFIEAWEWGNYLVHHVVERALSLPREELPIIDPSEVRFLPVVPDPTKVLAVGLNFVSHCKEQGKEVPKRPLIFAKLVSSLIGHREAIVRWPITEQLDYEGELAVVIGKGGRDIREEEALSHCAGFTIMNDVSARDIQWSERQWTRAKGLDTFGPLGPFITTRDEVKDPQNLSIRTYVNGELRQDGHTSDMAFSVAQIVAFASKAITLSPGDIISTGTPAGVGVFANPKRFLEPGDEVRIVIEGLGELVNKVVEPQEGRG